MERAAIYPGSFDPITNGHIDIVHRCRRVFPRVVVAILENPRKSPLFSIAERREMLGELFGDDDGIEVEQFDGLLVRFARRKGCRVIIRGLRAVSDFEYEFQMAMMNRQLDGELETLFMVPHEDYTYVSSSLIKEIYGLGGSIEGLVPDLVEERLREHFASRRSD
ncbi:MAG: pantetheine-phosphate adenylyltransferase [Acidobacteriota bacterium]